MSLSLYLLYFRFLKRRWMAAACASFSLAYYGLCSPHPLISHLKLFVEELKYRLSLPGCAAAVGGFRSGLLPLLDRFDASLKWNTYPLLQWRDPDPALDLPFLFLLVVAVSVARERRNLRAIAVSGLAFGALFYVYFYAWTLAAVGLCIAVLLDRVARRIYASAFGTGVLVGLPQLLHDIRVREVASAEALARFGLLAQAAVNNHLSLPFSSILVLLAVAYWIRRTKRYELIYLWSLSAGGILLAQQRMITGMVLHEYHWAWLWPTFLTILVVIALAPVAQLIVRHRALALAVSVVSLFYLWLGLHVMQTTWGRALLEEYLKYQQQRMRPAVTALAPGSVVAGDVDFCGLAAVMEDQRPLAGESLYTSISVDDGAWVSRVTLNAVLEGTQASSFLSSAQDLTHWLWNTRQRREKELAEMLRLYAKFSEAPTESADRFGVKYVSITAGSDAPRYLSEGWTLLQPGPSWQIWERRK